MSTFKDKFANHSQAKEQEENQKKEVAIQAEKDKILFENNFTFEANRVARPIFEEFAQAANESGYPAKLNTGRDGNGNEYLDVRFIPISDSNFGTNKSDESVFVLKCKGNSQKVAHIMYYDQRPGKNGKKEHEYGLQSIKEDVLRRELEEFLDLALRARDAT